jgi:hypothetical protein
MEKKKMLIKEKDELPMMEPQKRQILPRQQSEGANRFLNGPLVGTPRCGVRSAQRADPTKNGFAPTERVSPSPSETFDLRRDSVA